MFNDRFKTPFVGSAILLLGVMVLALIDKHIGEPTPIYGAPSYSITMDATNAPTTSESFVSASQTVRYTPFEYSSVKYSAGNHTVLDRYGRINNANASPITSVTSVKATFTTGGAFTLYSSYDRNTWFEFALTSGVTQEVPYLPYYLELYAGEEAVVIESLVITYTCTPHSESLDQYRIGWYNDDGITLLELDEAVAYGTYPSYDGPTPTKDYDPYMGTFFSFAGWDTTPFQVDGNYNYYATYTTYYASFSLINGGTEYELRSVSDKTLTNISVPSTYNGLPVTSIAAEVFGGFTHLTSVTLPSSLKTLSDGTFGGCTSLTTIHLPSSLIDLGMNPFAGCTSLVSITVDASNETYSSIDGIVFDKAGTTLLMYPVGRSGAFSIPEGTIALGDGAFFTAAKLSTVTIPDSVTTLGYNVFLGCTSLNHVVLPDTITTLGGNTFLGCTLLSDVTLPSGLTALPYGIFQSCTSLATVTLPSGLIDIEMDVFSGCTSLTSISIPAGVTRVGPRAFRGCALLESILLPEGLLDIGSSAFSLCESMTSISIPASVTSIGEYAFLECTAMTSIVVASENTAYASVDGVLFSEDMSTLICYPSGKTDTSYTIPSSVTTIPSNAFRKNLYLTSLIIPTSVTSINAYGIYLCDNVTLNCVASEQPAGWNTSWNGGSRPVVWGYVA